VATVWVPALGSLSGFAWVIGALLGAAVYLVLMWKMRKQVPDEATPVEATETAPARV
jgi:NCS1 family nucleobase:cation symporter-1